MDNVVNIKGQEDINIDQWVTTKATSGTGYIGRVRGVAFSRVAAANHNTRCGDFKDRVRDLLTKQHGWFELEPCFEYMAPARPMQHKETGHIMVKRDPAIILNIEYATFMMPVSIRPGSIVFLCDLQESDRTLYKGFVEQTLEMMKQARLAAKGIHIAGPGDMPPPPGGGLIRG
jgi:hypothetical protein